MPPLNRSLRNEKVTRLIDAIAQSIASCSKARVLVLDAQVDAARALFRVDEGHPVAQEARRLSIAYVACGLCGDPTTKTATRRCDRCWELESRIKAAPDLARRIIAKEGE